MKLTKMYDLCTPEQIEELKQTIKEHSHADKLRENIENIKKAIEELTQ